MKKFFCLLIGCCLLLAGCGEEKLRYGEEYSFSHAEVSCSAGLTIVDLSRYIPAGVEISSVEELEEYIENNFDTYSVSAGGCDMIAFKNDIQAVKLHKNGQASLYIDGEWQTVSAKQVDKIDVYDGETFAVADRLNFTFDDGYLYYSAEIDPRGFRIKYIFDNP